MADRTQPHELIDALAGAALLTLAVAPPLLAWAFGTPWFLLGWVLLIFGLA